MILHVLQRKEPFPESFYDWTLHLACLVSQKSKCKLIQPPEFDGAAPSSRGIGGIGYIQEATAGVHDWNVKQGWSLGKDWKQGLNHIGPCCSH